MNRRAFLLGAAAVSCTRTPPGGPRVLHGAGATLPYPLYARWSAEYARIEPNVRINYQPLGSGAGMRQIKDGVIDFGATDEPMTEDELARERIVQVPTTLGAVVIAYNLDGAPAIELTPAITADIFLGTIARWDDARIREVNPGLRLPDEPIGVVHRAEGSGTSATLTRFLSKGSQAFHERVGTGKVPRFPVGVGVKGNEGVAAFVKATPGSIGYVEHAYARSAALSVARLRNRRGRYVPPTLEAMDRAARSAVGLWVGDADDELAYPVTALSLVVVPREPQDAGRGAALARFLSWAVHDGQALAAAEGYAALPPVLVARAEETLRPLIGGG